LRIASGLKFKRFLDKPYRKRLLKKRKIGLSNLIQRGCISAGPEKQRKCIKSKCSNRKGKKEPKAEKMAATQQVQRNKGSGKKSIVQKCFSTNPVGKD
jgi:hypothetical protein